MDAKKPPPERYENRVIRERQVARNVEFSVAARGFEFDAFAR